MSLGLCPGRLKCSPIAFEILKVFTSLLWEQEILMLQTLNIRHHVTLFSQFSSTMDYLLQLYTYSTCTNDADLLPLVKH